MVYLSIITKYWKYILGGMALLLTLIWAMWPKGEENESTNANSQDFSNPNKPKQTITQTQAKNLADKIYELYDGWTMDSHIETVLKELKLLKNKEDYTMFYNAYGKREGWDFYQWTIDELDENQQRQFTYWAESIGVTL